MRFSVNAGTSARLCRWLAACVIVGAPGSADRFARAEDITLRSDPFRITVNEYGVFTDTGRGVQTFDGNAFDFETGAAEWYGVQFREGSQLHQAAGGNREDWAGRPRVQPLSLERIDDRIVVRNACGPLLVATTIRRDPQGPYLLVAVSLENAGLSDLNDIFYTREYLEADGANEGWTWPSEFEPHLPPACRGLKRNVWMLDRLRPGQHTGVGFSYVPLKDALRDRTGVDVPLVLWSDASHPAGLDIGYTFGLSWGDYDADGSVDLLNSSTGPGGDAGARLWRNDAGRSWSFGGYLADILPWASWRYGSSWADFNADGFPDVATEPRNSGGYSCPHLLRNLEGSGSFVDDFANPALIDELPCELDAETNCWGDVDADGDLDLFVPAYPPWAELPGPGNAFFENLGPDGVSGLYRFALRTADAGLQNPPPDSARPEGAQFADVDFDGDLDLYSNGTLYQNNSPPGDPLFSAMNEAGSGILYHNQLEEGCAFADYDMDGDLDLLIVYVSGALGVRIFENYGDGNFQDVQSGVIESPFVGLGLGCGPADWDLDGDIDFTTRQVFRRNVLMETGQARYVIASHAIPPAHLTAATPAWCDWDKDGDLDCALANYNAVGHFYHNTLYGSATPPEKRNFVRVRPVLDRDDHEMGLETEFGAMVELRPVDRAGLPADPDRRRVQFVASSAGYLTQNEYALTFAVPGQDELFDVVVTFVSHPEDGLRRIDRSVAPVLGGLSLAQLRDREITVYRNGLVRVNGALHPPLTMPAPWRRAAALREPSPEVPLPPDQALPGARWIGIDFDTLRATRSMHLRELIIDGHAAAAVDCGSFISNALLWNVTDAADPALVDALVPAVVTKERNRRSYIPLDAQIEPGRRYRLVVRVDRFRASPFNGPAAQDGLTVHGGFIIDDPQPCTGQAVAAAPVNGSVLYATFRFTENPLSADLDGDGAVGVIDLLILLVQWGPCPAPCSADLDGDGAVGLTDLLLLLSEFGTA